MNTAAIIIISPHQLIDNYNYNYYITENGCGCVYFYILFCLVNVVLTHLNVNSWRA